jgi:zinc protease
METYRRISPEDLEFTKNALIKSNNRRFEPSVHFVGVVLHSKYNLPPDYILNEDVVRNMTAERHKELAQKYIKPDQMIYVIAGCCHPVQTSGRDWLRQTGAIEISAVSCIDA